MKRYWVIILYAFFNGFLSYGANSSLSSRPNFVNIGSIFTFDSIIGKVSKVAVEAAVDDVNSNPDVLKGIKLNITMLDSGSSGFLGIIETIRFMETETVAIIGPQSSVTAHVVSYIANELQVPLLSFSATDPTLSPLQFPFFIRTSLNDRFQMAALADIIGYYEWREVILIYVDDDHGRNGIATLSDLLAAKSCQILYKAPLRPEANIDDIRDVLVQVALRESRIFIVHTYPREGLDIMAMAQYLGMMDSGHVWFATNWLSTLLDTSAPLSQEATKNIQGLVTLRIYTPESDLKKNFLSRWSNLTQKRVVNDGPIGLSTYGLYAYDTVWLLAHSLDAFFDHGGNISFSSDLKIEKLHGGVFSPNAMSIFNGGNLLLNKILTVNMNGVTGNFRFDSDRNLIHPAFEVINVIGTGSRRVGYWSNYSGLSIEPPDELYNRPPNHSTANQKLYPVVWPGQTTEKPRGWVFLNNGEELKIGVPNRVSFRDFVGQVAGTDMFTGYCIDVFIAAVNVLPYAVPYRLIPFGDGKNNPSLTELVQLITAGVYDAAIGDIAITTTRTRMVDFTQPYIESGLVVVAPVRRLHSSAWAFLRPFTREMWCITGFLFLVIGVVVWTLEHRVNDDFRGPPKRQLITIIWFSFSTLFFAHREKTVGTLGRFVLILWLFVVLIVNSSYTASLTSILTVQQLSSPIKGIESLLDNNEPIGYQQGSFTRDYLVRNLAIHESRLVPLNLPEDYEKALKDGPGKGGVTAIIDERPYLEMFLSTRCEFSILGREFTKNGWGFAFPRDSQLAIDMSTAILKLSENGDLQRIHDKWLLKSACSSQGKKLQADQLQLTSFEGLFLISGLACLVALIIHFVMIVRQFYLQCPESSSPSSSQSSLSGRLRTFLTFVDQKEEEVISGSKRRKLETSSIASIHQDASMFGSKREMQTSSSRSIVLFRDLS